MDRKRALRRTAEPDKLGSVRVVRLRTEDARGAISVARPSALGNPFPLLGGSNACNRMRVIKLYREWLTCRLRDDPRVIRAMARIVTELRAGHDVKLACWCAPLPCHAAVVGEVALRLASANPTDDPVIRDADRAYRDDLAHGRIE
jgi:hypothetical protein